jgi:hypothetical protein
MGLMDKLKEQTAIAGAMAKDAAQKGQAKVEEYQARHDAEQLLRELGALAYLGWGAGEPTERAREIVEELRAWEAEHGELG